MTRRETAVDADVPDRGTPSPARRFRLALVASLLVPTLLFAGAAWYDRTRLFQDAQDNVQRTAAVLREHALKAVETHELLVRQLDRHTRGMNWDEIRAAAPTLSAEMRAMHADLPQAKSMALTDAEGRQWAASVLPGPGDRASYAHREYWSAQREADRGTFVSRAYIGMHSRSLNFGISRRRTTPDGSFDGTVHVAVATAYFVDFWAEAVRGTPDTRVTLVRTDGEMLAIFPASASSLPRLTPLTHPLMRHLETEPKGGVYQAGSTIDGTERIFGYAKVGAYPLVIVNSISVASVLAVWWQHVLVLATVCALAASALAFAVLSATRQARQLAAEQARRAVVEDAAQDGQRLELLGRLAAGVAHDFRNVVQSVQGGAQLIERHAGSPDRVRSLARMVEDAARQGTALTQRMLNVARRDAGEGGDAMADPAAAVSGACELLSRTLGHAHRLRCEVEASGMPALVRGEGAELEAAVMNLVVNARDAMPDGGEVAVCIVPDWHPAGLAPGLYARVSVADTGTGMPPEVLARAGELFFTTKPREQGTGLGLAGVRSFAERAGGTLHIESAAGRGTTVSFWLPTASTASHTQPDGDARPNNVTPLWLTAS